MLKVWNVSYNKCRLYYKHESLTFSFDHKKNLGMFHKALNCYKREYGKSKKL